MVDLDFLISIAVQIPIVVLFAWFVIKRDKEFQATIEKRDKEWRDFFEMLKKNDMSILAEITQNLDVLAKQVAKNTIAIIVHDATVRGQNPQTMGSTEELLEKLFNGQK